MQREVSLYFGGPFSCTLGFDSGYDDSDNDVCGFWFLAKHMLILVRDEPPEKFFVLQETLCFVLCGGVAFCRHHQQLSFPKDLWLLFSCSYLVLLLFRCCPMHFGNLVSVLLNF
eukprot:RCo028857